MAIRPTSQEPKIMKLRVTPSLPRSRKRWPGIRGMKNKFTDPLLKSIEAYLVRKNMTATRFGKESTGDPKLVFELRDGRELRHGTKERIKAFLKLPAKRRSAA